VNEPLKKHSTPACVQLFAEPKPEGERCLVVMGVARGGTSMAAGLMRLMGVDLGERQGEGNNEDLDFTEAREPLTRLVDPGHPEHAAAREQMRDVVRAKRGRSALWGWKDPLSFTYLPHVVDLLPNPHILVVFKDMASIAVRETQDSGRDPAEAMERAIREYATLWSVLETLKLPTLAVSYDKTLRRPGQLVVGAGALIGRTVSQQELELWSRYFRPEAGGGDIDRFQPGGAVWRKIMEPEG
jgi:hypothetical protein